MCNMFGWYAKERWALVGRRALAGVLLGDVEREGCEEGRRLVRCRVNGLGALDVADIVHTGGVVSFLRVRQSQLHCNAGRERGIVYGWTGMRERT